MRIEIIEKNYRLNEKTKNLICEKLAKFERYFEDDAVACQPFYKLKNEAWKLWKNKIKEFCEESNTNVYAENALNELFNEGFNIHALDLKGELCMEIDTKEDLNKIKKILGY